MTIARPTLLAAALWLGAAASPLAAAVTPYVDPASFQTALDIAHLAPSTLDFDAVAAGTVLHDGDPLGGVVFHPAIAGGTIALEVANGLPTTSPANYLGLDQPNAQDTQIQQGDSI